MPGIENGTLSEPTKLSIIIVNWNTSQLLDECLCSVESNRPKDSFEVIVVDNSSSDNSVNMVQNKHPETILIQNSSNLGFAAANNIGISAAKGEYFLLLNSDTRVLTDVLQKSIDYMEQNPPVGAMGCRVLNTDGTLQITSGGFPSIFNLLLLTSGLARLPWPKFLDRYQLTRWQRKEERRVDVISGCYLLVRREVVEKIGGLDEKFFFFGEETDWCRRIKMAGYDLRFAPVGEIIHHGGGSVKRLSYQRDLMLSSALVKIHLKHSGLISAFLAIAIITVFHLVRVVFWKAKYIMDGRETSQSRYMHFRSLLAHTNKIWPRDFTWRFE